MSGPSTIFILRPIGTTLLAIGLFLAGLVAYGALPVSSLPTVDFPTIWVSASRPGADPQTMAATVAAPLERALGSIAGVSEMTSTSTLGNSTVILQFDPSRKPDKAARDVQAALNAAATDLPGDLPTLPMFRKANPNAMPVLILVLTSRTLAPDMLYDIADTVVAQKLSQVEGVGDVNVSGSEQPAIRIRIDPARVAAMGLSLEAVRQAVVAINTSGPIGSLDGAEQASALNRKQQSTDLNDYANVVVRAKNGTVVKLSDIAEISRGVRNTRAAGWYNRKPAVTLSITRQVDANVIETVDRIKAVLPELKNWIPAGVDIEVMSDRTQTIRGSVEEIKRALFIAIALVMVVVLVFMRSFTPVFAAGVTVPLSLAGTFALMWVAGYSLDNISLMALTVSVGFVVDDAIVMIETIHGYRERGMAPVEAAIKGARAIAFTVISISLSMVSALIPMIFMDGMIGVMFREFAVTLLFAIFVSTIVSLTVTPMLCAHLPQNDATRPGLIGRGIDAVMRWMLRFYRHTLIWAMRHVWLMILITIGVLALTVQMYRVIPKGFIPQDDIGLVNGFTEASPDVSFPAMMAYQQQAAEIIMADPAVANTSSTVGSGRTVNTGRFFIALKPLAERGGLSSQQVINRLRPKLNAGAPGIRVYLSAMQDMRAGGRAGKSTYQFTLWSNDYPALEEWVPKVVEALEARPELTDVNDDNDDGALQADIKIDRAAASRLGVRISDIDTALGNSFGQRQIVTLYSARNQYRVVMEVASEAQKDVSDLTQVYVPSSAGGLVPLSSVARFERGTAPLAIRHQGVFPAITITYDLADGVLLDQATKIVQETVAGLHLPDSINADFAGDAKQFKASGGSQTMLIIVALAGIYIILGVLYESFRHPLTILSTLPSAGLGALIMLDLAGVELSVIAMIGIILLIGIVKKNGIMMVDFAIQNVRHHQTPAQAIVRASLNRFRPILMTSLAAALGALPLWLGEGVGAELRRPLGITIVGGLILSQILTLYTTPAIYLALSGGWWRRRSNAVAPPPEAVSAAAG